MTVSLMSLDDVREIPLGVPEVPDGEDASEHHQHRSDQDRSGSEHRTKSVEEAGSGQGGSVKSAVV